MPDGSVTPPETLPEQRSPAKPTRTPQGSPLPFDALGRTGRCRWWSFVLAVPSLIAVYALFVSIAVLAGGLALMPIMTFGEVRQAISLIGAMSDWSLVSDRDALIAFAATMITVAALLPSLWVTVRVVHGRKWRTLITGREKFDMRTFLASLGVAAGLMAVAHAATHLVLGGGYAYVLDIGRYLLFLPLVLLLVPAQVLAEEVFFRAYLVQLVGRFTRRRAIVVAAPAAIFTAAHFANAEVSAGGLWVIAYFGVMSLYLTWLTVRGNGLEYAFGFHLATNLFALSVVTSGVTAYPTPTIFFVHEASLSAGVPTVVVLCAAHYWLLFGRGRDRGRNPQPLQTT